MKLPRLKIDVASQVMPIVSLGDSENVDGTNGSAQSSVIDGVLVRIVAYGSDARIAIGGDPTADGNSMLLTVGSEIWLPVTPGSKVAVYGGQINICTAGDDAYKARNGR